MIYEDGGESGDYHNRRLLRIFTFRGNSSQPGKGNHMVFRRAFRSQGKIWPAGK